MTPKSFKEWLNGEAFDPEHDDPIEQRFGDRLKDPRRRGGVYLPQRHRAAPALEPEPGDPYAAARLFVQKFRSRHPDYWAALGGGQDLTYAQLQGDIDQHGVPAVYKRFVDRANPPVIPAAPPERKRRSGYHAILSKLTA